MQTTSRPRKQQGFTLVEALVALLALSIGLLGVAALQMSGLRNNVSAAWRSQATYLAYDIIDRMRANRSQRDEYVTGLGAAASCASSTVCTSDLRDWKANLANTLPSGDGTVAVNGNLVVIRVSWIDTRGENQDRFEFETRSRL